MYLFGTHRPLPVREGMDQKDEYGLPVAQAEQPHAWGAVQNSDYLGTVCHPDKVTKFWQSGLRKGGILFHGIFLKKYGVDVFYTEVQEDIESLEAIQSGERMAETRYQAELLEGGG